MGELKKLLDDMKSGALDYTADGECSNCGRCCSDLLPVSELEIKQIKAYIKKHKIRRCRNVFLAQAGETTCPFRDEEKRACTIYPVRPAICREFRCDKPAKGIKADMSLFRGRIMVVSMGKTFYDEWKKIERFL